MMPSYHKSITNIFKYIKKNTDIISVVSFDVFDTLIHRQIAPPDQIKIPAAKKVKKILNNHKIYPSLEDIIQIRSIEERKLNDRSKHHGNDSESNIKDIVFHWIAHFIPNRDIETHVENVIECEINAEIKACYPVEGMIELIEKIQKMGKRIIFTSDMYLGMDDISAILNMNGYKGLIDKGYVSSEAGLNKKSGRLFKHILKIENISPSKLLHIGDKYIPDVKSPRKLGIHSMYFRDIEYEKWARRHHKLSWLSKTDSFFEGVRWIEMSPPGSIPRDKSGIDSMYAIGYWGIGPIIVNFIHQVINKIIIDKSEAVIFPSREGFILKELYDRLNRSLFENNLPPSYYVFLSRQSTFASSTNRTISNREISRGLSTKASLTNLITKLGMQPENFEKSAIECGFKGLDEVIVSPIDDERLNRFINTPLFIEALLHSSREKKELLYDYLKQFDFWSLSNIAFVDIGWDGSIQENLALTFNNTPEWPYMNGYYFALLGRTSFPCAETKKSKFHGIAYDYRVNQNHRISPVRFTDLFELALRAPHATVSDYQRIDATTVIPILVDDQTMSRKAESSDERLLSSLQSGILDYADRYADIVPYQTLLPENYTDFCLYQIDRMLRFPSTDEARTIRTLTYADDFEGFIFTKKNKEIVPSNKIIKQKHINIFWPEGLFASSHIPGLNYLFNFLRLLLKNDY